MAPRCLLQHQSVAPPQPPQHSACSLSTTCALAQQLMQFENGPHSKVSPFSQSACCSLLALAHQSDLQVVHCFIVHCISQDAHNLGPGLTRTSASLYSVPFVPTACARRCASKAAAKAFGRGPGAAYTAWLPTWLASALIAEARSS